MVPPPRPLRKELFLRLPYRDCEKQQKYESLRSTWKMEWGYLNLICSTTKIITYCFVRLPLPVFLLRPYDLARVSTHATRHPVR